MARKARPNAKGIIAKADHDEPCIVRAKLDMEAVARARAAVPSLTHDRDFLPAV